MPVRSIEPLVVVNVRRARPISLVLFVVLSIGWAVVGFLAVELIPTLGETGLPPNLLLVGGTVVRVVAILGLLLWLGRLRPWDVGLSWDAIPAGVLLTACVWVVAQGLTAAAALESGALEAHPDWQDPLSVLGRLARQTFAVALVEEVAFRGYVLPQTYLTLARRWSARGWLQGIALALSQALFTLMHLPFLRYVGLDGTDILGALPVIFGFGVLFGVLYLVTGNLYLAMGVHALATAPMPLFATAEVNPTLPITEATVVVLILCVLWARRASGGPTLPTAMPT